MNYYENNWRPIRFSVDYYKNTWDVDHIPFSIYNFYFELFKDYFISVSQ